MATTKAVANSPAWPLTVWPAAVMMSMAQNGFTARYMWREDGAAELYLYHMDKPGEYGERFKFVNDDGDPIKFEPGTWHNLVQRVQIN